MIHDDDDNNDVHMVIGCENCLKMFIGKLFQIMIVCEILYPYNFMIGCGNCPCLDCVWNLMGFLFFFNILSYVKHNDQHQQCVYDCVCVCV